MMPLNLYPRYTTEVGARKKERGKMANILRFKRDKYTIEIEPFKQEENGRTGTTYTLYPYPHGLSEDFDINSVESFDDVQEAIKRAKKILNI